MLGVKLDEETAEDLACFRVWGRKRGYTFNLSQIIRDGIREWLDGNLLFREMQREFDAERERLGIRPEEL